MSSKTSNNTLKTEDVFEVKVTPEVEDFVSASYFKTFEAIGGRLNKILKTVFSDYLGSEFVSSPQDGRILPVLYFRTGDIQSDDRQRAFEAKEVVTSQNMAYAAAAMTAWMSAKKKHTVTKSGMDILSNLVWCNKPEDFKWNDAFTEETVNVQANGRYYNQERIKLTGIDFDKLLRFIKIGGIEDVDNTAKYQIEVAVTPVDRFGGDVVYPGCALMITINNLEIFNKEAIKNHIGIQPQIQCGQMLSADTFC